MIRFYDYQANDSLIKTIVDEISDGWISKGNYTEVFEDKFKTFTDIEDCILVNNGTTALQCAFSCLGLLPGDEVIFPALGYMAAANVAILMGLKPIFVDVDKTNLNMSSDSLKRNLNDRTKCVVFIHNYGNSAQIERISELCRNHNVYLIEDCAEAVGTTVDGQHVGNFGDIATFSLHLAKSLTAGEGGVICTNNLSFGRKIRLLKDHGVDRRKENPYFHEMAGYNFRMSNIHAVIAVDSLRQLDENLLKKKVICNRYIKEIKTDLVLNRDSGHDIGFWAYPLLCKSNEQRRRIKEYLDLHNIETRNCFVSVGKMPFYKNFKIDSVMADEIYSRILFLPTHHLLKHQEVSFIIEKINDKLQKG